MNVTEKIKDLAKSRGWTEYRLVKKSGLATSTIANIYHRNSTPNISTLETLCNTFGITLSQFFSEDNMISLSEEQTELLEHWGALTPAQRDIVIQLLKTMH